MKHRNTLRFLFVAFLMTLLSSCGGSSGSGSTSQLVSSEVQEISGVVSIEANQSNNTSNLVSLSASPKLSLNAGVANQVAVAGVTVFVQLAKNGQICGQSTTGSSGEYTIPISAGTCRTELNNNQAFRVDARSATQGSGSTVSNLVSGYYTLESTNALRVNLTQRTTLQASVIDHRMTQVGLTQENLAKATSATDEEYAAVESIFQSALRILTPDFFGEDDTAKCDYTYTSSTEVSSDEVMDLHLLVCADTYLRNVAGSSRTSSIDGVFASAGSIAGTFYSAQVQTDADGNVVDTGFDGVLKFGLTVTENLGTTLSDYVVVIPNGVNLISNIEVGQKASFSNFDESTVWQTTTFTAIDVGAIPGTLVNPTFKYASGESNLESGQVSGSVHTTTTNFNQITSLCQSNSATCYEYTGTATNSEALVLGCMNANACNYSPLANRDDGSCATACDSCNNDGTVNRNVFCKSCDANQNVVNGQCASCPAGTTNAAGDVTTNGDTICDITYCTQDHFVLDNECVECLPGTVNAAGDAANGNDTVCDNVFCQADYHVVNNVCTSCPAGTENAQGDKASGSNTSCDVINCGLNEYVANNVCTSCPAGTENSAGDDASGLNTSCSAVTCGPNEHVVNNVCTACASGSTNLAGDDASGADTPCDATLCASNQFVSNNVCATCPAGTTNASGDDATGANTSCTPTLCGLNEYVSNNVCTTCPAGTTNAAGDDASGLDTSCTPTLCGLNEYVANNTCQSCAPGTTNLAGDDASGINTSCSDVICGEDEYVFGNTCTSCAPGMTNTAGDNASGGDTVCTIEVCGLNEYVSSNTCTACPVGTENAAGDFATGGDTSCTPVTCGIDEYVSNNVCTPCAPGTNRPAGDDATGGDTVCSPKLCAEDEYVAGNACVSCAGGTYNTAGDNASGSDTSCDAACTDNDQRAFKLDGYCGGDDGVLVQDCNVIRWEDTYVCENNLQTNLSVLGRNATFTTMDINSSGSKIVTVSTSSAISIDAIGSWVDSNANCDGCVTQLYVGIDDDLEICLGSSIEDHVFNESQVGTSSATPGIYFVNLAGTWQFGCIDTTYKSSRYYPSATLGILIVE